MKQVEIGTKSYKQFAYKTSTFICMYTFCLEFHRAFKIEAMYIEYWV